jgi:uncharacterized iron-regulated protein
MKRREILMAGILLLCLVLCSCSFRAEEYQIFDTETGGQVSLEELAAKLSDSEIVLLGEYHGNEKIHRFQAELIARLHELKPELVISMEMFERDTQEVLDKYLEGYIEEEEFIAEARAWNNYRTDYRPIIEYARENDLSVIAANVPRRYAADLSRVGLSFMENIPEEERDYLAGEVIITEDEYQERFFETMQFMAHHMNGDDEESNQRLFNIYAAQSLKDDTMAESIVLFREKTEEGIVVHLTGDFHIRNRLGIYTKLKLLDEDLKISSISPYLVPVGEKYEYSKEFSNIADYVIVLYDNQEQD